MQIGNVSLQENTFEMRFVIYIFHQIQLNYIKNDFYLNCFKTILLLDEQKITVIKVHTVPNR